MPCKHSREESEDIGYLSLQKESGIPHQCAAQRRERLTYDHSVDMAPSPKRHHHASEELEYLSPLSQRE